MAVRVSAPPTRIGAPPQPLQLQEGTKVEEDLPVADLADSFCPSLPLLVPPGARYLQHNDDGVTGSPEEEQNLYTRIEWALRRARHGP